MIDVKIRKPKKFTIKYYLRKDISPIQYEDEFGNIDIYYHLYIEFVYNRKINKCKSQFFKFVNERNSRYSFLWNIKTSYSKGFNIYGVKESVFNLEIENQINSILPLNSQNFDINNNEFLRLLYIEKNHIISLFTLIEGKNDGNFNLSNLSSGYQKSLIFVFDYFDMALKKYVMESITKVIPFFPVLDHSLEWTNFSQNIIQTLSIINLEIIGKENSEKTYLNSVILLMNEFHTLLKKYLVFECEYSPSKGISLPNWFLENHFKKLQEYFELNFQVKEKLIHLIPNKIKEEIFESVNKDLLGYLKLIQNQFE